MHVTVAKYSVGYGLGDVRVAAEIFGFRKINNCFECRRSAVAEIVLERTQELTCGNSLRSGWIIGAIPCTVEIERSVDIRLLLVNLIEEVRVSAGRHCTDCMLCAGSDPVEGGVEQRMAHASIIAPHAQEMVITVDIDAPYWRVGQLRPVELRVEQPMRRMRQQA